MGDYFKPLRRKMGVVTLVIACVFAAGWVRGALVMDDIGFGSDYLGCHEVELRHGVILWGRYKPVGNVVLNIVNQWIVRPRDARSMLQSLHATADNTTWEWRWNWCGFDFGRASDPSNRTLGGFRVSLWVIPYWPIVISLTSISAWLLLRPIFANPTETSATTGA
jgi:hypothetical protein